MATTKKDRKNAKRKKRQKKPNLLKLYRRERTPFDPDEQVFRITVIRRDMPLRRIVNVDGMVEVLEWRAEPGNPVLVGQVNMRKPDLQNPPKLRDGHMLRLQVRYGGVWREVWRMRMYDGVKGLHGAWTWQLADPMRQLQESDDEWHFTKSAKKGKPRGWLTHEIVREVARRYRIPVGKIAEGKHYITDLSGKMTPMQVIQKAYAIEKRANGRRFVIRWHKGKLNIVPMRRNPLMYVLKDTIEDAVIGREPRDKKYATALTVRATVKGKKGSRKREKIVVQYENKKAVARDGWIHRTISPDNIEDRKDAIKAAKKELRERSERKLKLEGVTHRGIALLRRGDHIRVVLPEFKFTKKRSICFISSGVWTLSGGEFTMSLDLTLDDPYVSPKEQRKDKDKKTRKEKEKASAGDR